MKKKKPAEPEVITLDSNLKKMKAIRINRAAYGVPYVVIDKTNYLLTSLDIQPYIQVNKEGVVILEYGREDGSFLNFFIYDEPKIHMVVTLNGKDRETRYVRTLIDPRECNGRVKAFYKE